MKPIRIIGIGNSFAGDDAVGIHVVRKLKERPIPGPIPGMEMIEAGLDGLALLDNLAGIEMGIIIDAVQSGHDTGTIVRLEIPRDLDQLSEFTWSSTTSSTHAFGLGEALTLGHTLEMLPRSLTVYGIEWGQLNAGTTLSRRVSGSIETVVSQIMNEFGDPACMSSK